MAILNKNQIREYCENFYMITPFSENKIKYASYDISVGDEYRLSNEKKAKKIAKNGRFKIPPHQVCFILSEEYLQMPNHLCALIFSRNRGAQEGFLMHPQPPIDPGYKGKLYILLHNLSNESVRLKRGEHLASIIFSRLDYAPSDVYGSDAYDDRYMSSLHLEDLVENSTFTASLAGISKSVESLRERITRSFPIIIGIIAVLLSIITILLTIITVLGFWKL